MASPQKEDGFTAIANEIMDALMKCCPGGSEGQVLMCIIRKTYGWHKKQDAISISQLSEATTLSRRAIIYAIQNLEAKNMIVVSRANSQINTISFQKDYESWRPDAVSEQWARQLQLKREKYHQKVVQRNDDNVQTSAPPSQAQNSEISALPETPELVQRIDGASAENRQKVVQRNVKNRQFSAPTKEIKKYTKETYTKEKDGSRCVPKKTFEEYREELRGRFKDLNFDTEYEKFNLYWSGGRRKCKNPSLALLNWMLKAQEIKREKMNEDTSGKGRSYEGSGRQGRPQIDQGRPITARTQEHSAADLRASFE